MNHISGLFASPQLYPLHIDFERELITFVRMSPDTYRESVFLDHRTKRHGNDVYQIRLDDALLEAARAPANTKRVHYILHTTFCCSTLLARYFEILPSCFVLKEPMLLTQLALTSTQFQPRWQEAFEVTIKLLTRTYEPNQMVVIKPHEPCNCLGSELLECNEQATITFLMTPLRQFLLSILKAQERRNWVRTRVQGAVRSAASCPPLADVKPRDLSDAECAAYLWLINSFVCEELASGKDRSRVLALDGERLAESPEETLPQVAEICGLPWDEQRQQGLIGHHSVLRYSKDASVPYDWNSRRQELEELERTLGMEADEGEKWAAAVTSGYQCMEYA